MKGLARLLGLLCFAATTAAAAPAELHELAPGAALGELPRIGVNLGGRTVWGAEQLMRNVLQNPGLELGHDGALLIVGRLAPEGVEDDNRWTARPAGFWAGASFEVLSGAAAGQRGRVLDNQRSDNSKPDQLMLEPLPAGLRPGDVLALQGQQDFLAAPQWWTQGLLRSVAEPRPGSPGKRSLQLNAVAGQPAALFHHLDSIGARAGKLLPVQGRWRLALWARSSGVALAKLRVDFGRHGKPYWVHESLNPGALWQRFEFNFEAVDDGPVGPLQLSIALEQGQVLLDDIELGSLVGSLVGESASGFRAELVQTLQQLRPGYLRDWQGQLGDSLSNRLASPFARQPTRYRPGPNERMFAYSIPEFLQLCALVGARPWLVLPATSTPDEARQLGALLAQSWQQYGFEEIVVEHGNEHWNTIFRPAGINRPEALAEVADRVFAALKQGAGPALPLHRVIGTQYVNPAASGRMAVLSKHSEGIAVAPYFHYAQDARQSTEAVFEKVLHEDVAALREALKLAGAQRHEIDVYELNFHTTGGDASSAQRDAVLNDPAAGSALLRRLLQGALSGVRRQAVYTLSAYDTFFSVGERRELMQLFGISRDLAGVGHWRPTGQALLALNQVMVGKAHAVQCRGPACAEITAISFGGDLAQQRWALVSSAPLVLRLSLPCTAALQLRNAAGPVKGGTCNQGRAEIQLPARGWLTAQP
jgi:hypothetical protein